ncbi:hypothetical protein NO263_07495 [Gluconacetobacter entanii]|uniref:Uncharacterized protein n=1 Tax=Gluconacetobacter entanii TaxID=108528 RepID=A0ABT3K4T7_9PROT|nr:hypothetical protein [Gluconacetobacter entanii]MCW4590420.1 hypothetical protein [Gluconacetobacter entanii]MCW4594348.1 hypothetical protein [Gluconacetobacter entanii]NPC88173.1 hypothetical protein [Gluconacetobacter entanii]
MTATTNTPDRLRKAWAVFVKGYDGFEIYYAPTAGKARMQAYYSCESARVIDIKVRRYKEADQFLPARHPIANTMTSQETHCLLHAFGATCGDPSKAGYRDYFYTSRNDADLCGLTRKGLMRPNEKCASNDGSVYFIMTPLGREVALSLTPLYGAR